MLQISYPPNDTAEPPLRSTLSTWNVQCELLETGFDRFWSHFSLPPQSGSADAALSAVQTLASAFQCLLDCVLRHCSPSGVASVEEFQPPVEVLRGVRLLLFAPSQLVDQAAQTASPTSQATRPHQRRNFSAYVARYLDLTFAQSRDAEAREEDQTEEEEEDDQDETSSIANTEEARNIADRCSHLLDRLQLRRRLLLDYGADFIRRSLANFVANRCANEYSESRLDNVLRRYRLLQRRWTEEFRLGGRDSRTLGASADLLPYRVLGLARIRQLFSMTIDYPDSECGLKDLAVCIERLPELRPRMVRTLRADVEQRLLHPGVATLDILSAYIGAVRSLRILDPSGVSQELALGSVAEYLRRREDTIRAIISKMIGDEAGSGGPDDLAAELTRSGPLAGLGENSGQSVDDPRQDFDAWRPDPVEAYSSCGSLSRQPSDLLSLLVGIYGSKRLFINEYQSMLASRLLESLSFKVDREIKNVELLKLRFGELDLIKSEVMLKDIEDSRRLCSLISNTESISSQQAAADAPAAFPVSALILSSQFWPAFAPRRMSGLPRQLAAAADRFAVKYRAQKCNRGLEWRPQLGRVQVRVELAGRQLELACRPAQYAILTAFLEHRELSLAEVAEAAQLQLSFARRNIGFWLQQGVLQERQPERFCLADSSSPADTEPLASGSSAAKLTGATEEEIEVAEGEAAGADGSDSSGETWDCLWNYVVGMLTNMDSCMSVERIRTMLQLFLVDPSVELDQHKLKNFLDEKVRDGRLTMQGSMYKLA